MEKPTSHLIECGNEGLPELSRNSSYGQFGTSSYVHTHTRRLFEDLKYKRSKD